ncbi:MAG: caspase family protein [Deltaproteobacteria bacterium]|nr:caspase family protein [Deltaproteobacteria bacterium]
MIRVWLVLVVVAISARIARADVERYALIVSNNLGDGDEQRLRYANDDAQRLHDTLRDLGGFRPENMLVLRDESATTVRRGLISLNDRIRTQTVSGRQSELLVYYSGHADELALHLGRTSLELAELEQLVRGSSATLRILILDSCRSGGLTHVKGGVIAPGFTIALDQRIPGDGLIFWTASAESESAQESEELRGSFFTHYLVSGLLGAADLDGDEQVTLGEAYAYAYENTLRATSRTLAGSQHPTFHYELGGEGEVVLAMLGRTRAHRASIRFPEGKSYLVMRDGQDGAVVAEIGAHDRARRLSVRPGRYFVRGRGTDFLLEGMVTLAVAEDRELQDAQLDRIAYAQLVRKGRGERTRATSLHGGYALRTALWSGASPCQGPFVGAAFALRTLTLEPRLGACRGSFDNAFLAAHTDELDLEVRAAHVWDVDRVALAVGVGVGGSLLRDVFTTDNAPDSRNALAAHLGVSGGATTELVQGFYGGIELEAMTYFFHQQTMDATQVASPFALRISVLLLGKRW